MISFKLANRIRLSYFQIAGLPTLGKRSLNRGDLK